MTLLPKSTLGTRETPQEDRAGVLEPEVAEGLAAGVPIEPGQDA